MLHGCIIIIIIIITTQAIVKQITGTNKTSLDPLDFKVKEYMVSKLDGEGGGTKYGVIGSAVPYQ